MWLKDISGDWKVAGRNLVISFSTYILLVDVFEQNRELNLHGIIVGITNLLFCCTCM